MKVGRVIIVLKYVHAELIRSLHPKAVITIKMADKVVRELIRIAGKKVINSIRLSSSQSYQGC